MGLRSAAWMWGGVVAAGLCAIMTGLHRLGGAQSKTAAAELRAALAKSGRAYDACRLGLAEQHEGTLREIEEAFQATRAEIDEQWNRAAEVEENFAVVVREKMESQSVRLQGKLAQMSHRKLKALAAERFQTLGRIEREAHARHAEISSEGERELARWTADEAAKWQALETAWAEATVPLFQEIAARESPAARFGAWNDDLVGKLVATADLSRRDEAREFPGERAGAGGNAAVRSAARTAGAVAVFHPAGAQFSAAGLAAPGDK